MFSRLGGVDVQKNLITKFLSVILAAAMILCVVSGVAITVFISVTTVMWTTIFMVWKLQEP